MPSAAVSYQVRVQDLHAHLFQVTLIGPQTAELSGSDPVANAAE